MVDHEQVVVLLMGPTACGKTDLAVELHRNLGLEVVSVDSAMVYRGMDIGTAKPPPSVLAVCPHRLIDICDPAEAYSAGRFIEDASREIESIHRAGGTPLLAGGTMLYFRALQQGLADLPAADRDTRSEIDADAARRGWPALHAELARVDPDAARRIEPTDAQRVQRALEVYMLSGTPLSQLQAAARTCAPPWRVIKLGLWPDDREALRRRITERFRQMMEAGFPSEVERLRQRPDLGPDLPSIRAVGYRQIWAWLDGQCSREEAVTRAVNATAQLAKRQLTWLRAEDDLQRLVAPSPGLLDSTIRVLREHRVSGAGL